MVNGCETTKIRFDLWAVLTFLFVLAGSGMLYLFNQQAIARDERTKAISAVCDRVTVLEQQMYFIKEGIVELKEGQREVIVQLRKNGNGK